MSDCLRSIVRRGHSTAQNAPGSRQPTKKQNMNNVTIEGPCCPLFLAPTSIRKYGAHLIIRAGIQRDDKKRVSEMKGVDARVVVAITRVTVENGHVEEKKTFKGSLKQ